jgi:hypothetical protein
MDRNILLIVAFAAACAMASRAGAQEAISYASVSGRVVDQLGAVVPGVAVTARHTETNITRETATDEQGRFRFPYLRVGRYEVKTHLDGFADFTRTLTLTVGAAFELPVTLRLAGLAESVTVSGQATIMEAARSQIAGTVLETEVRSVPLNGRNFLDLALLVPGVSPTNIGSTQLFAETSAVPGQGISVGSQRNFSNNFIVDGLSANDDAAGLSGIPYGVDAVDQFQVVTSGGQAELGRALGGYVSVVTKSGTNQLVGDAYAYFRDDDFNAPNALSNTKLPMSQKQYGASLGGPIRRDRTFYFANAEQRRLDQTGLATIADGNVAVVNARLSAAGYPGAPIATGVYANPVNTANLLAKVDHQFNSRDQFSVRYSLYDVVSSNSRGAGGLSAPTASAGLDNTDQSIAFSNTLMLSSRTVNETRAQVARGDLRALPSDPVGPAVNISGVAAFGTLSGSPQGRLNTLYQLVNNLSHQSGSHAIRVGADFIYNDDTITFPRSVRGAYTFSSLGNFLSGAYNNLGFTQTFGQSVVAQTNPNAGFYAQDEWKPTDSLTVNAGLRYDLQWLETIDLDANNVSPRLGVAWTPGESRGTIVRGSVGTFYDRIPLRALANALLSAGNTTDIDNLKQVSVTLSPAQAGAPVFPNILTAAVPSVTLVNFTTMDRGIQNGRSRQASIEVERQLGDRGTYSIGYQYVRGTNLIISINQNVPSCVAAGTNNGCRPNPGYANNSQYSSEAESNYHGLHASFVQRPTRWGAFRVGYTYSKSFNNVGEAFFSSPIDPFDLSKDWSRSDDDQRHRLVVSGTVSTSMDPATSAWRRFSRGFQLSGMLQSYSAPPFNITSGVTTVQGTAGRPVAGGQFIKRNAGIGGDFFSLGLRLSRSFRLRSNLRLEGVVEAFNVTNRRNDLTRNANFGSGAYPTNPLPSFNQITAVGDPRTFQFAARIRF